MRSALALGTRSKPDLSVTRDPDFDFLSDGYRDLFAQSDATAFQHPVWLDAFYRDLPASRDAEPLIVVGRDRHDGRLRFVLPLVRRRQSAVNLVEAAYLGVGDYQHPVVGAGWTPDDDVAAAVQALLPAADLLNIRPIRKEAVEAWLLFLPGTTRRLDFSAHAVALCAPFDHWRSAVQEPAAARSLDKKKKRFLKAGRAELTLLDSPADIVAAIASIARYRAGRFDGDSLQNDAVRRFYMAVARSGAATGFARTYRLTLDGREVAITFGLAHGGRFCSLLGGTDFAAFGKYSPGIVVDDLIMEAWLNEGGSLYDFTIGDEPYKANFGTRPSPIHAIVEPLNAKGRLALAAFDTMRGLQRWSAAGKPSWLAQLSPKTVAQTLRRAMTRLLAATIVVRPVVAEYAVLL